MFGYLKKKQLQKINKVFQDDQIFRQFMENRIERAKYSRGYFTDRKIRKDALMMYFLAKLTIPSLDNLFNIFQSINGIKIR